MEILKQKRKTLHRDMGVSKKIQFHISNIHHHHILVENFNISIIATFKVGSISLKVSAFSDFTGKTSELQEHACAV